jgi:arylsulfatase A-like enzyme
MKLYASLLFRFLLLAILTLSCSGPDKDAFVPNFVFILVDDLGWTDLGCYGSSFYETPNIDRLAGESMRFTSAYAACPVCSPTRASIMTGKYPARTGVTDWIAGRQSYLPGLPCDKMLARKFELEIKLEEFTIAEAMKEAGYSTFFAGKWHLGQDSIYWPEHQGFDINKGGWSVGSPKGGYFSPYENPRLEDGPEGENLTDRLTDESIRFLENYSAEPFFLYLSFYTVHNPQQGKPELVEKYKRKIESEGLDPEAMETTDREWIRFAPPTGRYVERVQQGHPVYASMVETLDTNVGRLMHKIAELGLEENTIVIFMSDNGGLSTSEGSPTSNLPLRGGKGWMYEGGVREPMLIKWPGSGSEGSISDVPVISTDFYPTILDMAGLEPIPGQHMDGVSLVPLITGTGSLQERPLFWHYPHYSNQGGKPGAAVRLGDFKLIEFFDPGQVELYNLAEDIGETRDLAEEMPEKTGEMLNLLHSWQQEVGARGMDPNPAYDPEYLRVNYLNKP